MEQQINDVKKDVEKFENRLGNLEYKVARIEVNQENNTSLLKDVNNVFRSLDETMRATQLAMNGIQGQMSNTNEKIDKMEEKIDDNIKKTEEIKKQSDDKDDKINQRISELEDSYNFNIMDFIRKNFPIIAGLIVLAGYWISKQF